MGLFQPNIYNWLEMRRGIWFVTQSIKPIPGRPSIELVSAKNAINAASFSLRT